MMYKLNFNVNSVKIEISKKKHLIYISMILLYLIGFIIIPIYSIYSNNSKFVNSQNYLLFIFIVLGFIYFISATIYKWKKDTNYIVSFDNKSIIINDVVYSLTDVEHIVVTKITVDYRYVYRVSIILIKKEYTILHYSTEEDAELTSLFLAKKINCKIILKNAFFDVPWRW